MQNILKKVVLGCLFIVPFVALYISAGGTLDIIHRGTAGLFFPFITGKNFLFRMLIEIAFFSWIILAISDVKYRIKKSPLVIAYSVFMVVILLADIFGVNVHESLWSNFERMEGFVGHLHMFAYFIVLSSMLNAESDWLNMLKVFVASNILVMGYGFMQFLGCKDYVFAKYFPVLSEKIAKDFPIHMSSNRLDSTIGNSAYYAIYCLFFVFISSILYAHAKTNYEKGLYAIIAILNLISLFYTGTRGTMVGILVGGIATLAIIAWYEKGRARKILVGALVAVILLVGGIFTFKTSSFIQGSPTLARVASISPKDLTGMSRLTIWNMSYEAWKERPILGYGQDNFIYVFPRYFVADKMWNQEPWFDRSHNVFFDWLVAGGILGLISYLSIFIVAMYLVWKKGGNLSIRERAVITGAFIGYFIHNVFVFDNLTSYILFFALLAYIVFRTNNGRVYCEHRHFGEGKEMVYPLVALLFVSALYYMTYLPHKTNTLLVRALDVGRLSQTYSFEDILRIQKESFGSALGISLTGKQEVFEQFLQNIPRVLANQIPENYPADKRQAILVAKNDLSSFTKNKIEELSPEYKDNVRVLDLMGAFYVSMGDGASAEKILKQALDFSPNKQLIMFDLVRAYLSQGKNNEALDEARKAYELQPLYVDAQKFYIISSIFARKFNEAKQLLVKNNQTVPFDGDIINYLVQNGQKGEAINMLNAYKKANPIYASQVNDLIKQIIAK